MAAVVRCQLFEQDRYLAIMLCNLGVTFFVGEFAEEPCCDQEHSVCLQPAAKTIDFLNEERAFFQITFADWRSDCVISISR